MKFKFYEATVICLFKMRLNKILFKKKFIVGSNPTKDIYTKLNLFLNFVVLLLHHYVIN